MRTKGISTFFNRIFPILIIALAYIYVIVRAVIVPITHDEVNTVLHFSVMPLYDIVTYTDPTPNNHILHTLLVKLSTSLFGTSQITARLPNVIGFALYVFAAYKISRAASSDWRVRTFAICAFLLNPFVDDFFSLARGYALAIDFMMVACWYTTKWLVGRNIRWLICALFFAVAAVYTNFTLLNFYLPYIVLLAISAFYYSRQVRSRGFTKEWSCILVASTVLASISYLPITRIRSTGQLQYWGTEGFYKETLSTLVRSSLYGKSYLGNDEISLLVPNILVIMAIAAMAVLTAILLLRNKGIVVVFFNLLIVGSIVVPIVQYVLIGTPYLSGRTALLYYPLFVLAVALSADAVIRRWPKVIGTTALILTGICIYHASATANIKSTYEWWFDANTKQVLHDLKNEKERTSADTISLNCSWYFHPSLSFYIRTDSMKWLKLTPYHKETDSLSNADYYYTMGSELPQLTSRYKPVLNFDGDSRVLMIRKDSVVTSNIDSVKATHQ